MRTTAFLVLIVLAAGTAAAEEVVAIRGSTPSSPRAAAVFFFGGGWNGCEARCSGSRCLRGDRAAGLDGRFDLAGSGGPCGLRHPQAASSSGVVRIVVGVAVDDGRSEIPRRQVWVPAHEVEYGGVLLIPSLEKRQQKAGR